MSGAVVIGAGPGIGRAVAERFAREGLPVAVLSRRPRAYAGALALPADVADEDALRAALDEASARLGPPDAVVYNAALIRPDRVGALPPGDQRAAWAVNVGGAITTAAHVLPGMARRGSGTFVVTGGMPVARPGYVSLSLGKAAVRALVELLDEEYAPAGVHVATVTVAGTVAPGTPFDPDVIAEHYWRLHTQPRTAWEREVVHDGITGLSLPVIR
jgi:NAD(P)-dependent dehydrogenase (short-subunit alcohol dehydrogenase family)